MIDCISIFRTSFCIWRWIERFIRTRGRIVRRLFRHHYHHRHLFNVRLSPRCRSSATNHRCNNRQHSVHKKRDDRAFSQCVRLKPSRAGKNCQNSSHHNQTDATKDPSITGVREENEMCWRVRPCHLFTLAPSSAPGLHGDRHMYYLRLSTGLVHFGHSAMCHSLITSNEYADIG